MTPKAVKCTILLLLLGILSANAQHSDMAEGDFAMREHDYEKAVAFFKKAAAVNPTDIQINERLGAAYMANDNFEEAEIVYQKLAANPRADKIDKFYYAQALRNNAKYDMAEKAYQDFAAAMPNDPRAIEFKHFGDALPELLFDRGAYDIVDIPENSDASDVGPVFCLYDVCFSSNRGVSGTVKHRDMMSGKGFYDLYLLPGGSTAKASLPQKLKGDINGKLNEGPCTFSRNGREIIFTRTNYKVKAADGTYKLGLYHADYDTVKQKWVNIQPLNFINYNYNMAHPSLSKDGKKLFFASDMPGGFGLTDIYVSEKAGNSWGEPVNLGKDINTPGDDMFPFISDKGILFFSSDSRVGLGGLDIYAASNSNGQWGDVHNLGVPFNTSYDDFGFICDEQQLSGYFVSNRPGGKGSDDIYKFTKKTQSICGQVLNVNTKEPVPNVTIQFISVGGDNAEVISNKTGAFCLALEPGIGYFIIAESPGYNKYEAMMSVSHLVNPSMIFPMVPKGGIALTVNVTKDNHPIPNASVKLMNINSGEAESKNGSASGIVQFDVTPKQFYNITLAARPDGPEPYKEISRTLSTAGKKPGDSLSISLQSQGNTVAVTNGLPNLYFGNNSYEIPVEAYRNLNNIASQMRANPKWHLEISAYSDWTGTESSNPDLAAHRAQACIDYLVAHGIDKKRLITVTYGNKSAGGEQNYPSGQNRRVQFKVTNAE